MPPDLALLYDIHARAIFAFLLNLTRNDADAGDILQDVFVKIAERPVLLNGVKEMRPWLIRMAHRQAIDLIRRRGSHTRAIEASAEELPLFAPAEDADGEAFRAAVAGAMAELPEEQRAVVHLKIWEAMTFAEIADALGLSANTAASRYRYALDKLEALLRPLNKEYQP
jgi:RNA polymerase sigma-70 factor (ECF subfamily)